MIMHIGAMREAAGGRRQGLTTQPSLARVTRTRRAEREGGGREGWRGEGERFMPRLPALRIKRHSVAGTRAPVLQAGHRAPGRSRAAQGRPRQVTHAGKVLRLANRAFQREIKVGQG